ncbi:MAG: endolytic transglycosylase MltG [Ruminococcaceae bacterium]|nr:endolytic transglycosylase MltG [Oscillospiraceae bacterium]
MSNEPKKREDLDSILDQIYSDTLPSVDRFDLENRSASYERAATSYVSFEMEDEEFVRTAPTQTMTLDEEDVRIFDGDVAKAEETDGSTRVIDMPEEQEDDEDDEPRKGLNSEAVGCLGSIIYVFAVLVISTVLAFYIYKAAVDVTGIGRSTINIDVNVPEGASTAEVAELLKEKGVIKEPFFFRAYCRVTHADGSFHPGVHTVSANMGYDGIVDELQTLEMRDTVTVTIREGSTIDMIAKQLEEYEVCTAKDFYTALATYNFDDYDFIAELSEAERADRVYLLEGYLFPDTYEFYLDASPETAIRTMLDNFGKRVDADTRASIKASGKTLNEILILASIAQMEAGEEEDMPRVMRVIRNRIEDPAAFPYLQLDSTEDYLLNLLPMGGVEIVDTAYNTYERHGLPVGAICNPGLAAINAALNPSTEPEIVNCYYFASIVETGETEFFETFEEHEAWCVEHGVGMYQ